jgi:stage V sporulation protein G
MPATTNQNNTQGNTAGNSMEQLQMEAVIMQHNPERGVLASADVKIGGFMTIRNVRIKEDDYGLTVSMPRTKMPQTDQYKDSVYFADRSMKEQFDQIILNAYQNSILSPVLNDDMPEEEIEQRECMDQEEAPGMSMVM